MQGPSFVNK